MSQDTGYQWGIAMGIYWEYTNHNEKIMGIWDDMGVSSIFGLKNGGYPK